MAIVRPFKALRPTPEFAEQVVSLPYDVMNREEATNMVKNKPYNYLHICRSEIDMPEQNDPYDISVYKKAKTNINQFISDGVFVREEKASFYIYRQIMDGRSQTGFVGCASIDDYINGAIKRHELTRKDKELDRINHFDICNADTEPVFFTYKQNYKLSQIISKVTSKPPLFNITDDAGINHILWVVSDDNQINKISEIFKTEVTDLYIADGHHRSASAVNVGLKRRKEHPDYKGNEEFNFFMAVIFPDSDLEIFDYNRVVKDLNGYSKEEFLSKVSEKFIVEETKSSEPYRPEKRHHFGMFLDGKWYKLTAKPDFCNDLHPVQSLDVYILQNNLLSYVLGIDDPTTNTRISFVGGIRGLKELERRVNENKGVAFALHPVSINQLTDVADEGLLMPPKSTWFEPKIGSGLFIHEL